MDDMLYDRDGNPITFERYAELFTAEYQRVVQDDVITPSGDLCWVSTVWLGVNHDWMRHGLPLIFETAIFWQGDREVDIWNRYPTEQSAREGHALLVAALTVGLETVRTIGEEEL